MANVLLIIVLCSFPVLINSFYTHQYNKFLCPNTFQLNPKHIRYGATTTSYSPEESFVDRRRYTWEAIVESFRAYRDKFGDVEVPNNFVIPVNEEWPQNIQGLKFGREIHLIRSMSKYVRGNTQRRRFLQSFGFDFNAEKTIKPKDLSKFEIFIEALLFYKQIHGDVDIDEDFIVPHQEPWPETCWGMCLSTELQAIVDEESNCLEFPIRREILKSHGVKLENIDISTHATKYDEIPGMEDSIFGFDPTLMFASTKYNELAAESYRDELRKLDFSPSARVRSFSHFLGQHSPEEISNILSRHYLVAETEASMRSLGYRVCEFGDFLWNDVIECLELYRSKYGDVNVPNSYVIRSSEKFPRRYTGMKLGAFVEGLKIGDFDGLYDEERQRKLEDLGFVWGDMSKYLHFRFTPYLLALRVYTHLHDFLLPDDDFVIPNEPQWPIWMVGLPFGKWTNNIRIQKKVIEKFYPERKAMLDSLDFTWWVPITFIPPELQK